MKKILIALTLVLLIFFNPSKMGDFKQTHNEVKSGKSINILDGVKYKKYNNNIILINENKLIGINSDGEEIFTQNMSQKTEEYFLSSNYYIDIYNKRENLVYSINEEGKTIFRKKVAAKTIMYKSIDKNNFISVYEKNDKEYIKIYNIEGIVVKEIPCNGKITHIEKMDENIIVSEINTEDSVKTTITLYDKEGNKKQSKEFEEIAIDIVSSKENIFVVFENSIRVFNNNFKESNEIKINGVQDISLYKNNNIYVLDKDKKLINVNQEKSKKIRVNEDIVGVEVLDEGYITYSDYSIYNEGNKEVKKFEEKIDDIISINKDKIVVFFNNNIKILKIS